MVDARYTEPLYRSHHGAMDDKTKLVESFQEFTGNTVSPESISLAKACIKRGGSKEQRYAIIHFDKYLQQNQDTPSHLTMMTSAYDLLLKYVINLLKVKRPQVWRSIKTNNTAFKARVSCMSGAEEILRNAGYTEPRENSMCFPESVDEPDKARLSTIAAELLMAKLEVELMNSATPSASTSSSSPRQQHQMSSPRQQQRSVQPPPNQSLLHTQPEYSNGPPSYQRGTQPFNMYSGSQPMAGYNSSQPLNNAMVGYNSMAGSQPSSSGPQPMAGSQSSNSGPRPMAGYNSSQPPSSGPQPMVGYNSSQPPSSGPQPMVGYNSMAGSQPPSSGPQPMAGYNSSQPPTNAMAGSQPPSSGLQPMVGYNSMAGSQPPSSGPQPMAGYNSSQPPNNAMVGYTNNQRSAHSASTGQPSYYTDGRMAGYTPGVTEVNTTYTTDNRERSQMNPSSGYPPTSQSAVRREDFPDNQSSGGPPAQYRMEQQSNTTQPQPVPRPKPRVRRQLSSNTPPTSPASQDPPNRDPPPELDPPVSMGSHRSSSGEMLSLSSSASEDSLANSVVDKARDFLEGYRLKKKQNEDTLKQRTVDFTVSTSMSPQASRKATHAATSFHAVLPSNKQPVSRTLSEPPPQAEVRSSEGYKQPPKKKQPSFHNDPILELPELNSPERPTQPPVPTPRPRQPRPSSGGHSFSGGQSIKSPTNNSAGPLDTGPDIPPKLRYCSECNNKLGADNRFCAYCGQQAPPADPPQPVRDPPQPVRRLPMDPPQDPPLRASHQDAVKAEEYHRRTQVIKIDPSLHGSTMPFTPVPMDTPPVLPPRATPRQVPPGPPKQAWEETVPPQQMLQEPMPPRQLPPPGLPKQAWGVTVPPQQMPPGPPPKQAWEVTRPPPIPPKTQLNRPQASNNGPPQASNNTLPHDATGLNTAAMQHLREKEEAWKSKQRRDGVREEDLQPLSEPGRPTQDKSRQRGGRPLVDMSLFPRTDTARPLSEFTPSAPGDAQRVETLNRQGRNLLSSVKMCLPWDYSLEEIQLAFSCDGRGLDYLQNEWRLITEQAQRNLSLYKSANQFSVGTPSNKEMRKALAKAGGNIKTAEIAVFKERENKVKQLLERVDIMRGRSTHVPGLGWEGAVSVLSANGMDVDTAFYVLQCDWLKPLHDYIFDEKNKDVLVHQKEMVEIKKVITNKDLTKECRTRLLMAECTFTEGSAANIVLELLEEVEGEGDVNHPLQYYVEAARDHKEIGKARSFFIKECLICYIDQSVHEFVALPGCSHSVCKGCFKRNFGIVIREKEVKHFTCPVCGKPDMANEEITNGVYLEIFVQMIHENLDEELYQLCLKKLRDFNLIKELNFIWCSNNNCQSGFIHEGRAVDVTCPSCDKKMCRQCKKPWERPHEGISCEAFAKWKIDNDPNAQELGLAAHLQANGIECPQCRFKYDLARGGCMHFKCIKCPNEFCSGCGQSIKRGQECGKLESCKTRGLHSHHPRDCLFYLRDFEVAELQAFLTQHTIEYDTAPKEVAAKAEDKPAEAEQAPMDEAPVSLVAAEPVDGAAADDEVKPRGCRAMLQKETMEGLKDEECGKDVVDGHAGLCSTHYREYLVDLINKNKLDPISMYPTMKIELMLTREEMAAPDKDDDDDDNDDVQRAKLIQHVKELLPLPNVPQAVGGEPLAALPNPVLLPLVPVQ